MRSLFDHNCIEDPLVMPVISQTRDRFGRQRCGPQIHDPASATLSDSKCSLKENDPARPRLSDQQQVQAALLSVQSTLTLEVPAQTNYRWTLRNITTLSLLMSV